MLLLRSPVELPLLTTLGDSQGAMHACPQPQAMGAWHTEPEPSRASHSALLVHGIRPGQKADAQTTGPSTLAVHTQLWAPEPQRGAKPRQSQPEEQPCPDGQWLFLVHLSRLGLAKAIPGMEASVLPNNTPPSNRNALRRETLPLARYLAKLSKEWSTLIVGLSEGERPPLCSSAAIRVFPLTKSGAFSPRRYCCATVRLALTDTFLMLALNAPYSQY